MRNLRTEVLTLYLVIAMLFFGTSLIDSYFDYQNIYRNTHLLSNYERINQAIVSNNHCTTSFRLYNRNKNIAHYDDYVKTYSEVMVLLEGLSEAFKENEKTLLYHRISLQMLEERNNLIEEYVNYHSLSGDFSVDYEWITLMGNYIGGFLNDLLSAYLAIINQKNSEALALFSAYQTIGNFVKVLLLVFLAFSLTQMVKKSKQALADTSHVMQELANQNFGVEDISLSRYEDLNKFIVTTNTMKQEIRDLILQREAFAQQQIELEQQKRLLVESRFKELQHKINPHFLFNTLSMIIRHIQTDDKQTSIRLVKETSILLRNSLKTTLTITLDEELELLRSYLFIQQLLLQNRIDLILDIRRGYGTSTVSVPPLIIQPLVENAVMHGLKDVREGGLIEIHVVEKQDFFEVLVQDNGQGMPEETVAIALVEKQGHVGLHSVYQRLALLYQRDDVMTIQSEPGKGTLIRLCLYKEVFLSTPS